MSAAAATAARKSDGAAPSRPRISNDLIPFGKERKRETAAYSQRHYGQRTWRLGNPRVIVLHYTTSATYAPARNTFASNAPVLGELPGSCAHFIIGKNGVIHRIVPLGIRCRHTIGLNWTAIGIEMVQEQLGSSHRSDLAILHRHPQINAALHLVRWLQAKYGIKARNVIGHAMANHSPYFKDREVGATTTPTGNGGTVAFRRRLSDPRAARRRRKHADRLRAERPGPPAGRDRGRQSRCDPHRAGGRPDPRRRAGGAERGRASAPPAPRPGRRRPLDREDRQPGRQPAGPGRTPTAST